MEADRYRLIAARACPWAHRAVITRRLMGLENSISLGLAGPTHDIRSWTFDLDEDGMDQYWAFLVSRMPISNRFPEYPRSITVPAIVEESSKRVVTNDYPSIVRDFIKEWSQFQTPGAPNLPEGTRLKWKR